jgi:hypothetical protein
MLRQKLRISMIINYLNKKQKTGHDIFYGLAFLFFTSSLITCISYKNFAGISNKKAAPFKGGFYLNGS